MQNSLQLVSTIYTLAQLENIAAPQIAFAGRSNVGKSSLINALAGRKQLAKTSSTPGKTRSINFYSINNEEKYLVDLPGYGYARCSQEERNKWAQILEKYLSTSSQLRALALLLDARLEPQKLDVQLAEYAYSLKLPLLIIFTKTDKCTKKIVQENSKLWGKILPDTDFLYSSSTKKRGVDEIWEHMFTLLA